MSRVMLRPSPTEGPRSQGVLTMEQYSAQQEQESAVMSGLVDAVMKSGSPAARIPKSTGSASGAGYFGLVVDTNEESTMKSRPSGNWSPPGSSIQSAAVRSPMLVSAESLPASEEFHKQQAALANSFHRPNLSNTTSFGSTRSSKTVSNMEDKQGSVSPLSSPTKNDDGEDIAMPLQNLLRGQLGGGARNSSVYSLPADVAQPTGIQFNLSFNGPVAGVGRAKSIRSGATSNTVGEGDIKGIEPERLVELLKKDESDVLILDVRTYLFYAQSRIRTAVNLCIPTTLLKRPSFNVSKLSETIASAESREKFDKWKTAKYIVVYDADSNSVSYAISKFTREGWKGEAYYLTCLFSEFALKFPDEVEREQPKTQTNAPRSLSLNPVGNSLNGGIFNCPLPTAGGQANAFFSNVRQNMDLIGGVGEIPITLPRSLSKSDIQNLPTWLRRVCAEDAAKRVSEAFLNIEKAEQQRMQNALKVSTSGRSDKPQHVLAGLESGTKNRYNNIWPYDHARVKLLEFQQDSGDYINASHIWAKHSSKRYIATQGPLPSTFVDFWSLVWEQDVRVIVMLTAESEGGQLKCHAYWTEESYGPYKLTKLSEHRVSLEHMTSQPDAKRRSAEGFTKSATNDTNVPYITVRKFTFSHTAYPFQPIREITQLQYAAWPDFGAPVHPAHILGLIEHTDAVTRSCQPHKPTFTGSTLSTIPAFPASQRPILVHCSAGCGRTGTFCAVDSVIGMLRRQRFHKQYGYSRPSNENEVLDTPSSATSPPPLLSSSSMSSSNFPTAATPIASPTMMSTDETESAEELAWLERDDIDLIAQAVEDFRDQRLSMVQSLRQFVLCYETVLEWMSRQKPVDSGKRKTMTR